MSGSPRCVLELAGERLAVEARRGLGLMGLQRLALDEKPLAGEDRRQSVMALGQFPQLAADAEEAADEILEMGRQLDQEGRFLLARQRRRTGRQQALAELRGQALEEERIDARQAFAGIEIGEGQAMGKPEVAHDRIPQTCGAVRLRYCQATVAAASAVISATS